MFESTRLYIVGSQLVYNRLRNVQHHTAAHLKMSKKNTETKTSRSQPEPASSPQITINQGPDNQQHQVEILPPQLMSINSKHMKLQLRSQDLTSNGLHLQGVFQTFLQYWKLISQVYSKSSPIRDDDDFWDLKEADTITEFPINKKNEDNSVDIENYLAELQKKLLVPFERAQDLQVLECLVGCPSFPNCRGIII